MKVKVESFQRDKQVCLPLVARAGITPAAAQQPQTEAQLLQKHGKSFPFLHSKDKGIY